MVRRDILPTGTDCAIFYPHGLFVRRRKPLTAKYNTTLPRRGTSQLHIFTAKRSLATSLLFRRPDSAGHTTAGIPHVRRDVLLKKSGLTHLHFYDDEVSYTELRQGYPLPEFLHVFQE